VKLVVGTHNEHKVGELRRILGPVLPGVELVAYDGPDPIEDGETFAANALIKARTAAAHTGEPAIADDSGIAVDALGGAPGIHSARYAGTRVDTDNVRKLLDDLDGVQNRSAHFVCAAALVTPGGGEFVEIGMWPGSVLTEAVGPNGFGYDPVFKPNGLSVSSAELRPDEKDAISHRSLAFRSLAAVIRRELPA
jgi:XTP/dITP diphosphohydrolase